MDCLDYLEPVYEGEFGFHIGLVRDFYAQHYHELDDFEVMFRGNCGTRAEWAEILARLAEEKPRLYDILTQDYIEPYYGNNLRAKNRYIRTHYLIKYLKMLPRCTPQTHGLFASILTEMSIYTVWVQTATARRACIIPHLIAWALLDRFPEEQIEKYILQLDSLFYFLDACKQDE